LAAVLYAGMVYLPVEGAWAKVAVHTLLLGVYVAVVFRREYHRVKN
jgi:hypothetical protein